jgi:phage terminase large subunit-like protein
MPRKPAQPFTVAHFRLWARQLILDTGQPWELEPFQIAFVRDLFAGRPENWFIVPEGNAKTTLIAGLALYHAEFRDNASVPVAASSRDQAEILYRQAEGFVLRSPYLYERVHSDIQQAKGKQKTEVPRFTCLEGYRRINHFAGGRIQVFAADDRTGDGVIPTLALVDELHRHRDMRLYRTWAGKLDKRHGQLVTISTAGEPGSEFEQARERIRQDAAAHLTRKDTFVRAITPSLVLHEWAVPENGDVEDIKLVKRANPLKAITAPMLRAKLDAPTMTLTHWRRFVCNLPTRSDSAAISESEWEKAKTDDRIPEGQPVWVGLDVAWKWDTTAIVPYWFRDADFQLLGPATVLVPPRDGQSLDPHAVERALTELNARNPIHTVVMDPSRAEQLAAWIYETFGSTVIERGQSAPLAVVDYDRFMEGLRAGTLHHSGDAALTEHALNAIARVDRFGAARFDRSTPTRNVASEQSRRVIDALTAAAMVHAQALVEPPTSVYTAARGLVEIG